VNETDPNGELADDPLWYKDAVIYQTHVKAFYDTDGDGIGDFRGLTQRLDYIRDLGVNAVWLLPFFPSPMRDDGYDIADYRNVYPAYGTRRDFRRFVAAAHRRGIRVIIELVINHTSDEHPWFQAARRAPKGSSKRAYYVWNDDDQRFPETRIIFTDTESSNWAWDPVAEQYYWHRFFSHQPDLNHNNPQVVKAVIRVMRFWLDMGVDGLRLDAIPYLCVRDGTNNENLPETHAVIRRMRAVVDAHYKNRMFLAEANQWPEDVRDYFGDGDECHLAYHFPLMPRMYMALAQEDRHPVVEIMEQTPEIPPSCQWAIFLRNHDELTLEMVSDRERDYMYQTYASDPRMRINVGIRRRLTPLLDNDPAKVRLMYSLLLSMPGSPVIYYGDELGMGDNIYLGDRNAVRTPMQWSPDRNAGFSRADPQRLYLPPVMDPVYGYQSVNVEAQQRDAASMLNWMRRVIEVRKAHRVFGRGTLDFLRPGNRKILAYVREWGEGEGEGEGGEAVLCVANLGRGAQPVELDLSRFQGRVPVEMLGHTPFPPIGELPYLLTLPGYAFYWFVLSREAESPAWHEEVEPALRLLTLVTPEGWDSFLPNRSKRPEPTARAVSRLERQVLPSYLGTRRWFAAKGHRIHGAALGGRGLWRDWLLALVRVEFDALPEQRYFLPLSILWEVPEDEVTAGLRAATLARIRRHAAPGLLVDAFADERFVRALIEGIRDGDSVALGDGARVVFSPTAAYERLAGGGDGDTVRLLSEGNASAAAFDDRFFLKGYRRLRPGIDPAIEIGRFLTEVSPFPQVVQIAGWIDHLGPNGEPTTLAVLEGYVPNQGDLHGLTLELLPRLAASHGDRLDEWETDSAQLSFAALVETLGRRVAGLHRALAQPGGGESFTPEPITPADLALWRDEALGRVERVLGALAHRLDRLAPPVRGVASRLLGAREGLLARVFDLVPERIEASRQRCHGDLHLGQVLVAHADVVIINFDGGPGESWEERRAKRTPLVDVGALVASLSCAARTARTLIGRDHPGEEGRIARPMGTWTGQMIERLVAAYIEAAAGSPGYPADHGHGRDLIRLCVLERLLAAIGRGLAAPSESLAIPIEGALTWADEEAR
jgi:maltose alpha-D-glucosyltransferase/alpha-amylase